MCERPRTESIALYLTLLAAVALAAGNADLAAAAPEVQQRYQIVVAAIPDLAGDGPYQPECAGCDGSFDAGDSIRGRLDPLPPMVFILRNAADEELRRVSSVQQSSGRQQATLVVDGPGDYYVELRGAPSGWELCPGSPIKQQVTEDDFEAMSGTARLQFGFWHGCESAATATPTPETADTPVPDTATPSAEPSTAVPTGETVEPTAEATSVATSEATSEATEEASEEASTQGLVASTEDTGVKEPAAGSGAVLGLVYIDVDGNGQLGPDEPGVAGVEVYLVNGGWLQHKPTTGAGNFRFASLAPDTYEISIDLPAGYRLTTTDSYTHVLVEGEEVAGFDFGLERIESQVPAAVPLPGLGLPSTGVLPQSSGRVLLGLAAVIGLLGLLGLAIESGSARRS